MSAQRGGEVAAETILVRYWAGARAAAGVDQDVFEVAGPVTLAEVVRRVLAAHPAPAVEPTIRACSVLVGDRPVSSRNAADVEVGPGSTVEFLPPFAGG
ncbi:MoaD/ThiS family protein [Nocardioides piscis]|uniref:MoaD/ThiS family protein n=1 Tax=Nocardioides piscis TaxID=2714938 RepID=A0A6G7YF18_9ACTN|nr:MoaD/ThiS family protein [Nocardioides piscis]QIK75207.1 MoaD/ThiS family protein [Nocardioides piscis]